MARSRSLISAALPLSTTTASTPSGSERTQPSVRSKSSQVNTTIETSTARPSD